MKKNAYLWIFIGVAVVVCTVLLMLAVNQPDNNETGNIIMDRYDASLEGDNAEPAEEVIVDLTQEDIDFEEDADDLSEDFVDDAQFDEVDNLDSVENEVY
ncbi:MAG: hypothetical protein ACWGHO_03550 [Candidatus Moraniibacteriota bacterium]